MHKIILVFLLVTTLFAEDCIPKEDTINTWYRLIPVENSETLEFIQIDMSMGLMWADPYTIYLLVFEKGTGQKILMSFPNGNWFDAAESEWTRPPAEPKKEKQDKDFDLDEYLKKNKGKGLKVEARVYK